MADAPLLQLDGLSVSTVAPIENPVIEGLSLEVPSGQTHAVIDRTGSGRQALSAALLGRPTHRVTSGRILFRGDDITAWPTDVRAKAGVFLGFADPANIAGVGLLTLLSQAIGARGGLESDVAELRLAMLDWMTRLDIDASSPGRLDQAESAVEARRMELLQLAILGSELAIFDEPDPELAADQIEVLVSGLAAVRDERPSLGTLAITHCQRLIDHLEPDHVHVMVGGRIVASGGPEPAIRPDTEGYESVT